MKKHSLAQAMKVYHVHNEDYFCNSHFMLKKSILNKTELKRIEKVDMDTGRLKSILDHTIEPIEQDLATHKKADKFKPYKVLNVNDISNRKNAKMLYDSYTGVTLNEYYYNFICKVKKCTIHVGKTIRSPLTVFDKQGEFVGIVLPMITRENESDGMDYNEYMKALENIKSSK